MSIPVERIVARPSSLGEGLTIRRALPTRERRMVGAWCFLDHIGPVVFGAGQGMHVGAHPHTALQTFTWMIEGEVLHRDSLGTEQIICPGQVNLMTAGWGISHTEDSVQPGQRLHAAQLWIALPPDKAAMAPAFEHHPVLPVWEQDGCAFSLLMGEWEERLAPTTTYSPLVAVDLHSQTGANIDLPLRPEFEYAVLPLEGSVFVESERYQVGEFACVPVGQSGLLLALETGSRALLIGGEPYEAPLLMWWNFVGASKHDISVAQADWESRSDRFGFVAGAEGRRLHAPAPPWKA
ncbi:MAG TPA: pirin family protein [Aquabacterium sp.]|nr:pirin family protein [Aquabacterium sp.]